MREEIGMDWYRETSEPDWNLVDGSPFLDRGGPRFQPGIREAVKRAKESFERLSPEEQAEIRARFVAEILEEFSEDRDPEVLIMDMRAMGYPVRAYFVEESYLLARLEELRRTSIGLWSRISHEMQGL